MSSAVIIVIILVIVVAGGAWYYKYYKKEGMIAASTITGMSRGYNAMPYQGDYSKAMLTLSEAEHANISTIDPQLYTV